MDYSGVSEFVNSKLNDAVQRARSFPHEVRHVPDDHVFWVFVRQQDE